MANLRPVGRYPQVALVEGFLGTEKQFGQKGWRLLVQEEVRPIFKRFQSSRGVSARALQYDRGVRNLSFEVVEQCRPPARKAAFIYQDDGPSASRCRGHTGGLLSGIGCVNADV